jgi:hypothetical protein
VSGTFTVTRHSSFRQIKALLYLSKRLGRVGCCVDQRRRMPPAASFHRVVSLIAVALEFLN